MQVSIVRDYITKVLRGENASIPHSLPPGVYLALLPSIWAIINNPYPELSSHTTDMLQALLDHALKTSSKSSTKRYTIEFVARLILVSQSSYHLPA
jgi:pre-rRNA-processing protein IPI1